MTNVCGQRYIIALIWSLHHVYMHRSSILCPINMHNFGQLKRKKYPEWGKNNLTPNLLFSRLYGWLEFCILVSDIWGTACIALELWWIFLTNFPFLIRLQHSSDSRRADCVQLHWSFFPYSKGNGSAGQIALIIGHTYWAGIVCQNLSKYFLSFFLWGGQIRYWTQGA